MNETIDELERRAWIEGNTALAGFLAMLCDAETKLEEVPYQLEVSYETGFDDGKDSQDEV
jgi:hypothetical protein